MSPEGGEAHPLFFRYNPHPRSVHDAHPPRLPATRRFPRFRWTSSRKEGSPTVDVDSLSLYYPCATRAFSRQSTRDGHARWTYFSAGHKSAENTSRGWKEEDAAEESRNICSRMSAHAYHGDLYLPANLTDVCNRTRIFRSRICINTRKNGAGECRIKKGSCTTITIELPAATACYRGRKFERATMIYSVRGYHKLMERQIRSVANNRIAGPRLFSQVYLAGLTTGKIRTNLWVTAISAQG